MPRILPEYNAIATSETVQYQLSSGAGKDFIVWQDLSSDVKLVKCDLCSRFMPLQGRSMSTSSLKRHRDGAGCRELVVQNENRISGSASRSLGFQAEVGPSNIHLPQACEFMLQV